MAKPTGGISLSTNFGLNASLPLDARDLVDTKADLLLFDKTVIEDGHIVYCKEDSNCYLFDAKEGATGSFKNLFSSPAFGAGTNPALPALVEVAPFMTSTTISSSVLLTHFCSK